VGLTSRVVAGYIEQGGDWYNRYLAEQKPNLVLNISPIKPHNYKKINEYKFELYRGFASKWVNLRKMDKTYYLWRGDK